MIATTLLKFALAAVVSAAPLERRDTTAAQPSAPFQLYVESSNATLNGSYLEAAHSGAAIEQLLVTPNKTLTPGVANTFTFNVSSSIQVSYPDVTGNEPGLLVWTLPTSNYNVSSPLSYSYSPFLDDALVLFEPTTGSEYWFKDDKLIAVEYTEDKTTPVVALDRWYACTTPAVQGEGYSYFSIHWALGARVPSNLSCQKVSIVRKFI